MDFIDKVICGHNVDVMAKMPSQCVDLIITSPPYDHIRDYKGYCFDFEGIANECYRVLKPGGVMVYIIGDQYIDGFRSNTSIRQLLHFETIGFKTHDIMIWIKDPRYPGNVRYSQCFEFMFILSKGIPKTIHLLRDRENITQRIWPNGLTKRLVDGSMIREDTKDRCVGKFGFRWNAWFNHASTNQTDKTALEHPASFPDQLAEDHILSWSNPNDLILDPFLGSGTTAKMSYLNHRHYCGIDISPEYCTLAEKRIHLMSPAKYQSQNVKEIAKQTESLGEY